MRHVDRLVEQLMSWSRVVPLTYERAWEIAETVAAGGTGQVVLASPPPLQEVMARHGLSRSAAYRLLDRWAEKDEEGRYVLDDSARDAIHEEVAVRRVRSVMIRLLMEGRLVEGMGPKSMPAARRWLERHWKAHAERLVRRPLPADARTIEGQARMLERLERLFPGTVRTHKSTHYGAYSPGQ